MNINISNLKASTTASPSLKVAGIFAGIGGFEMGLTKSGHSPKFMCELDSAANSILRDKYPTVPLHDDIRTLKEIPPEIELIAAGFPCQDLSSSGLKEGIGGKRSSLVGEVFRLLSKRRTQWVLIENVHFMLHLNRGAAIKEIVSSLEELGYKWAHRVLDSAAFGLPQRRRRVFILASLDFDPREVLLSDNANLSGNAFSVERPIGFYWTEGTYSTGLADDAIPPLKGGSTIGIPSAPAVLFPNGKLGTPDIRDAERLQGFPENWTLAAEREHKKIGKVEVGW